MDSNQQPVTQGATELRRPGMGDRVRNRNTGSKGEIVWPAGNTGFFTVRRDDGGHFMWLVTETEAL